MMSFLSSPAKITSHLYLGGHLCAKKSVIRQYGITHVINLTVDIPPFNDPSVKTYKIVIEDSPNAKLEVYFDSCADKIHQIAKEGGRVLVHCVAGVSRSASICIAYLMKYQSMYLQQAYKHVKSKRSVIRPNVGFFQQLIEYEQKLLGRKTVKMVKSPIGYVPDVYKAETNNMVWTTTYKSSFGKI